MSPDRNPIPGSYPVATRWKPPAALLGLLYLAALLLPLALAHATGVAPAGEWSEAASAAGCVGVAALVVQFLTSGRFEVFAGRVGIDVTMAFHKQAARWLVLLVVLHPLLYVAPTLLSRPETGLDRLVGMFSASRFSTGVAAWIAVLALVVLAVARNRLPANYEVWRGVHFGLAVIATGGALHHALSAGTYSAEPILAGYWAAAGLTAIAAIAGLYGHRWWHLHRRPWRLTQVRPIGTALWALDLEPCPGTPPLRYQAGQFVWMSVDPRRFPLFDHPFSIASSPREPGLQLIVKEIGDFTGTIGQIPPGTLVGLDGPHGAFTLEDRQAGAILLVAGGVGIAPVLGLLRDLVARGEKRPVRLVYGAGSPDKIVARQEIEAAAAKIDLQATLLAETGHEGWTGTTGLIDRRQLERALTGLDRDRSLAMICGPDAMITSVADTLLELGMPLPNVVYERFDYSGQSASRRDVHQSRWFTAIALVLAFGILAFAFR